MEKPLSTTDQAQGLYLLLQKHPGKIAYLLGYVCGGEFTTLGYLVKTRELVRVRINLDGHVTGELWQEHAVDRLKSAANGGSLDDTPKGKRPGGFVSRWANPEGRAK